MFKKINQQIIKRFCHIHSKTNIQENIPKNKKVEDLIIIKQNKTLDEINYNLWKISEDLNTIKIWGIVFGFLIAIKPS